MTDMQVTVVSAAVAVVADEDIDEHMADVSSVNYNIVMNAVVVIEMVEGKDCFDHYMIGELVVMFYYQIQDE